MKLLRKHCIAGKKLLISPIKGQYEQAANAAGAERLGVSVFYALNEDGAQIWEGFLNSSERIKIEFPDYAEELVQRLVNNVENGRDYDDISSLQVW